MPSNVTDWGAAQFLAIIHGLVDAPSQFYVALCTDEPGTGVDGTVLGDIEPDDMVYARVQYGSGTDYWSDPTIGQYVSNVQGLVYGVPSVDWGRITHFARCDSLTGGNVYDYGEFNVPTFISSSFQVTIDPGSLTIALRNIEPSIVGF